MLRLRKGKKVLATYKSSADFADDIETLTKYFPQKLHKSIQYALRQNMFGFAIKGASMRLGNGYIFENKE